MKMKKGDIIIVSALLIFGLAFVFILSRMTGNKQGEVLRIEKNSVVIDEVPLDVDREIVLDEDGQFNKIVIENGFARMEESNCRDQICVHMSPISKAGETIVCLPNRVFLEVVDKSLAKTNDEKIDKVVR